MKTILISTIFLFSSILYSQKNIVVIDSHSKNPISFANIKVLNSKKGFHTNERGLFELKNNWNIKDTLLISCLGYSSIRENISKIIDTLFLSPKTEKLKEIIIHTKKPTFKKVGFKKKHMTIFTGTNLQIALFISPKQEDQNSFIDKLIIPVKKKVKHIKKKKEEKKFNSILKVSLFSMKVNLPHQLLTNTPILIKYSNNSKNSIIIDLSNEYIKFDENGIFICLEITGEVDENGAIINKLNPRPGFVFTDKKTKDFNNHKAFYKTKFNNKWIEFDEKTSFFKKDVFPAIQLVLTTYGN